MGATVQLLNELVAVELAQHAEAAVAEGYGGEGVWGLRHGY